MLIRSRKIAAWALIPALLLIDLVMTTTPANANITKLVVTHRTCGTLTAYLTYDGFSEGIQAFYGVFAVDLNNNGVFSEAGEPILYIKLTQGGGPQLIGGQMRFAPLPEGSTIAITAYEIDSAGVPVSKQVEPVAYQCLHKPARDILPENTGVDNPTVGVVAKVRHSGLIVYSAPSYYSAKLGGLGKGAFLNVLALNARGDWAQVQYKGKLGWIMWATQTVMLGQYSTLPRLANFEDYTPTPVPPTLTPAP